MKRQENVAAPCKEHMTLGIRGQFNHSIHSLALFASSRLHSFICFFDILEQFFSEILNPEM